jgi:hypothetical protein
LEYSPLDKLNFLVTSYGRLFAAVIRVHIWFPFFILALFQAAGLLVLSNYYISGLDRIVYPVLSRFFPSELFHYPQYYLALPSIYSGYNALILGPTVWVLMSAAAVYKLGGYFEGKRQALGEALGKAFKSYFPLMLFWIIETAIVLAVLLTLTFVFRDMISGSPRMKFAFEFGYQLVAFIFSAFLVFTIPAIILSGKNVITALGESLRICSRNFFLTYFVVAIPASLGAVLDLFVSIYAPQVIALFDPGLVPALLYIRIGLGIFINLFIYGASVFVYKKIGRNR